MGGKDTQKELRADWVPLPALFFRDFQKQEKERKKRRAWWGRSHPKPHI